MSKMIQIRNVPDTLHRRAKARAAEAGMSLSDYLLREIRFSLERPTRREVLERVRALPPVEVPDVAAIVREERERRGAHLLGVVADTVAEGPPDS